jgi:hypothetical protein
MKIRILLVVMLALVQLTQAQKFVSKNAHVWFYSHTPVEDIEAHNHQVVSILDHATGDLAFNLLVKAFTFKIALMQEHFNENYMESDKYPKSTFKGKITNIDKISFKKDGVYQAEVSGELTIHNVTRPVTAQGTLEVKGGSVIARAEFIVAPKDYNIAIPSVVENKIAREIEISLDATYSIN